MQEPRQGQGQSVGEHRTHPWPWPRVPFPFASAGPGALLHLWVKESSCGSTVMCAAALTSCKGLLGAPEAAGSSRGATVSL